jgi:hypothetical protein
MNRTFALSDAAQVIREFTLSYGQPFGLSIAATDDLARQWAKILDDCTPADVQKAVDDWTRHKHKWPTASQIRDEALKISTTRNKPERSSYVDGEFCPSCHTRDLISVGKHQRFMPLHTFACATLHESDLLELRAALEANTPVWRNGKAPQPKLTTVQRSAEAQQRAFATASA